MKRTLIVTMFVIAIALFIACSKVDEGFSPAPASTPTSTRCGTYNGHTLYKGSQGGCYYKKASGVSVYVDRSKCRC